MSRQMPMTSVLNEAFRFGISRYWTIVRCLLVPYLILFVGAGLVVSLLLDYSVINEINDGSLAQTGLWPLLNSIFRAPFGVTIAILMVAVFILSLPIMGGMTSLYRLVGLGEEPGGWFSLRFDAPMWRLVIASIIFTVIQYIIYAIGYGIAYSMNPDVGHGISEMVAMLQSMDFETGDVGYEPDPEAILGFFGFIFVGGLITLLLSIMILTKLAPFISATACENRLMLISSWRMTKGNFWTILGAYILMLLAFFALNMAYGLVTLVIQTIVTLSGVPLLEVVYQIIDLAVNMALTAFMIGVQIAFASVIYRTLWLEGGDSEAGPDGLEV